MQPMLLPSPNQNIGDGLPVLWTRDAKQYVDLLFNMLMAWAADRATQFAVPYPMDPSTKVSLPALEAKAILSTSSSTSLSTKEISYMWCHCHYPPTIQPTSQPIYLKKKKQSTTKEKTLSTQTHHYLAALYYLAFAKVAPKSWLRVAKSI